AISGSGIDADEDGAAGLVDLVVDAGLDRGQILALVDLTGAGDGCVDYVVGRTQGEGVVEQVGEDLTDAAQGAVANQDQGEDELANPAARDRQVERRVVYPPCRAGEGRQRRGRARRIDHCWTEPPGVAGMASPPWGLLPPPLPQPRRFYPRAAAKGK